MSQSDTREKLPEMREKGSSLFALGLGVAGIVMVGWNCALAWMAWRFADWLFS